jgi:hypothetical protein
MLLPDYRQLRPNLERKRTTVRLAFVVGKKSGGHLRH